MQQAHIREGQWYAVSSSPRKGVKPENLHKTAARKYYVVAKGASRYAAHAKDDIGERNGGFKDDGILVKATDDPENDRTLVLKPRDFLMPWREYEQRVEQDAAEAAERLRAKEEAAQARQEAADALTERLVGMGLVSGDEYGDTKDFYIIGNRAVQMSLASMNQLLDSISDRVYELLASAE